MAHELASASAPLLETLLDLRSAGTPPEVAAAADALLRQHAPWALDVDSLAKGLIEAAGEPRDRRVFLAWSLASDPPTFAELGKREGLTRRRANDLVRRAEDRVRRALPSAPVPLPWLVSTLASRLGGVVPAGRVGEELDRLGVHKEAAALLGWLAGPYLPVPGKPGWVATDPKTAVSRTAAALAEDGGTRRLVDLKTELADLRITTASFEPWVNTNGAIIVHDLAVSVGGTLVAGVERVLDAYGTPRTPEQLQADLAAGGRATEVTALSKALHQNRFRASPTGEVALSAWPCEHAQKSPGKKRQPPPQSAATAQSTEGPAPAERFWLWVRVDTGVIKGSEGPVPVGLVEALGLSALSRRTFSSRFGPVTLANEPPQATRGPLRAVVLAAGARPDDTVLLGFSRSGDMEVEVRRGPAQPGPTGISTDKAVHFQATATGGAC